MLKIIFFTSFLVLLVGCGKNDPSYSLLPAQNIFSQSVSTLNNKIDILWVIDNSGSMAPTQTNLANNFNSFIQAFSQKNYDFHIGVTVTDAFRAVTQNSPNLARLRDGLGSTHSNVFVIDSSTPNINSVFITNMSQGISGSGDERAFQSFKTALSSPLNAGFRRPDAYLAIIIVSDEDDFSANVSGSIAENYNSTQIHTVASYVDYLDQLVGASSKYSVSAIAVWDAACKAQSHASSRLGVRYGQIVDMTGGIKGSICSNFAATLDALQNHLAELSTQFVLNRVPIVASIQVIVNGMPVLPSSTNGWTYDPALNSVFFHGTMIPAQGAEIIVNFDPVTVVE
ncbi:MAG: hypothetical protein K2X47_15050 [Bdellovibrionales bacterium]|nr:hypothetical protein [Bdellovibrionales bacterium]